MKSLRQENRLSYDVENETTYRRTLMVFVVTAAIGPYLSLRPGAPGYPYAYRVVIVLFALAALRESRRSDWGSFAPPRHLTTVSIAWILWAPLTLMWTPAFDAGLRQVIGTAICLAGSLIVLHLARGTGDSIRSLKSGYILAFVATSLVALWELGTGRHLADYFGVPNRWSPDVILATFYNPNNYGGFLLAVLGVLLAGAITSSRPKARVQYVLIIVCIAQIYATGSRGALLGAGFLILLAFFWLARIDPQRLLKQLVILLGLGLLMYFVLPLVDLGPAAPDLRTFFQPQGRVEADSLRITLAIFGLKSFGNSMLLGTGAGSFVEILSGEITSFQATNAHNTFVEIAAEYGFVIALPLLILLGGLLGLALFPRVRKDQRAFLDTRMEVLFALVAIVVSGITASSLVAEPTWWLLIAYATSLAWNLTRRTRAAVDADSDATKSREA